MDLNNCKATRQSYGEELLELGKEYSNIVVLDADLSKSTMTNLFSKEIPERFFDIGIAEQDMMATAAGLATCNKIPFVSTFAVFACGRAYDQIRNSICYPNLNVKICATHGGITVGEDGATHQMLEDFALMRVLPNMRVFCPSDDLQTKWLIRKMSSEKGPMYARMGRLKTPSIYDENDEFNIGGSYQFGYGKDGTIFACGMMVAEAIKAQKILKENNIDVRVVDMYSIKPIDRDVIIKSAKETGVLISVEEHSVIGGLGSSISEVLTDEYPKKLIRMGINDRFGKSGNAVQLMKFFKLTAEDIAQKMMINLEIN